MDSLQRKRCILNMGLYKTGTTTLAKAAQSLSMKVHDQFPSNIPPDILKAILLDPSKAIDDHLAKNLNSLVSCVVLHEFVSDGWFSLLPLASKDMIEALREESSKKGVQLQFVATQRDVESYLKSELHHWVRHDIEKKTNLLLGERFALQDLLRKRYQSHQEGLERLSESVHITRLDLFNQGDWVAKLSLVEPKYAWNKGLEIAGTQNSAPDLPIQAILVTMRMVQTFDKSLQDITLLLNSIEMDSLCTYMLVLALDDDEYDTLEAQRMKQMLEARPRLESLHLLRNNRKEPLEAPKICQIWASMAEHAWMSGASWVVFLGDDVRVECPFHYRAIYRYFLDNQEKFNLPQTKYFGCPWFDDEGFKGFPTFPIVGREHFHIFGGLIPAEHKHMFVNQDLDPYLQRIYLKFGAAPVLNDVTLTNACGGSDTAPARYYRVPAVGWRERVLENACVAPIQTYLRERYASTVCSRQCMDSAIGDRLELMHHQSIVLLDVVIPSYRIELSYLQDLCSIEIPTYMRTTFIIIVDNPLKLVKMFDPFEKISPSKAASMLEMHLVVSSGTDNNIRVRCNDVNMGASASRNRGIKESAAEYILFLDDDVIPEQDILRKYGDQLQYYIGKKEPILGLLGFVQFPRDDNMSVLHAGIFMSYLIFSFEIARSNLYSDPAWGVTANILFKKFPNMTFDTRYAKTGGGEDVDFALRLSRDNGNLKLKCCPSAKVTHLFWKGGIIQLCKHFFNWANGDSALFNRFDGDSLVYASYLNYVETCFFLVFPYCMATTSRFFHLCLTGVGMFACDVLVDMSWNYGTDFHHRLSMLEKEVSIPFAVLAHVLANFYVIVLECGRLGGHLRRGHVRNIGRRFDWHCGQLENSKKHFVQREKVKFFCFIIVLLLGSSWKTD